MKILDINAEPLVSFGIKNILQQQYKDVELTISSDYEEIMTKLKIYEFNLIFIDIGITLLNTNELLISIQKLQKSGKVLIFSNAEHKPYVFKYIAYGVSGFLDRGSSIKEVQLAVKLILSGNIYFPREMLLSFYNHIQYSNFLGSRRKNTDYNPISKLSKREMEAFKMIIKGKRIKDISETMKIHQSTTSILKRRIMEKLNVDNIMKLKVIAVESGYTI